MNLEIKENEFLRFWFADGIMYSEFKKPVIIDLEMARRIVEFRHEVSNNTNQYWCFDLTSIKYSSKESYDYFGRHGQDYLFACAVVVNSQLTTFLFNVFLKLSRLKLPLKVFSNKADACKWLWEIKNKN